MSKKELFLSIDIEANGPSPLTNSMLSFAVAAFTLEKHLVAVFSVNLEERPGTTPDKKTMKWWNSTPKNKKAYDATRINILFPQDSINNFQQWLNVLKKQYRLTPIAYPAGYDYMWIQAYNTAYARNPEGDVDNLLGISCFDLKSYVHGGFFPRWNIAQFQKKLCQKTGLTSYLIRTSQKMTQLNKDA